MALLRDSMDRDKVWSVTGHDDDWLFLKAIDRSEEKSCNLELSVSAEWAGILRAA
jgi:hypothetical protein